VEAANVKKTLAIAVWAFEEIVFQLDGRLTAASMLADFSLLVNLLTLCAVHYKFKCY